MSETSSSTQDEVAKRLRESRSLSMAYEKIMNDYSGSTVLLLGPAAQCDLLVIDDREGRIIAVGLKDPDPPQRVIEGYLKLRRSSVYCLNHAKVGKLPSSDMSCTAWAKRN